jgi:uncharacterized small protein (DUF1192 family)
MSAGTSGAGSPGAKSRLDRSPFAPRPLRTGRGAFGPNGGFGNPRYNRHLSPRSEKARAENQMTNGPSLSLAELEQRIAIARDNIRQLIEQAAAFSGAEDEDRNADRIAQQQEELDRLVKQRDLLLKK